MGYHIKGNIFDAIKATQIIEIDGSTVYCLLPGTSTTQLTVLAGVPVE